MASNLNYKQVVNTARRTWDVEAYEKRARDRAKNATTLGDRKREAVDATSEQLKRDGESQEEFVPAASGATGPQSSKRAFLKARTNKIQSLDAKIGSIEIVNPEAAATSKSVTSDGASAGKDSPVTKSGVGWYCKVCDCFLKDSLTYLDHINGRKHQRNLGYSMRVERSTKDQVVSRLEAMVKEQKRCSKATGIEELEEDEEGYFNDMVRAKDEELKRRKEERKRERKERKRKKKERKASAETKGDEVRKLSEDNEKMFEEREHKANNGDGLDPSIAAMMGFSGFGGGNKNR